MKLICIVLFAVPCALLAQDLAGSKDPPGTKRYAGSEIIGYRDPKFDEYIVPLGAANESDQQKYVKSITVQGQVSRYTYLAPAGRSVLEVMRNYKLEFQRLGLTTLYEKSTAENGSLFGGTFSHIAEE